MEWRHFSPETDPRLFRCSETGEMGISEAFVTRLDQLRETCGFPFRITSGYRSPRHSVEARKPKPGTHTQGIAADIACWEPWKRFVLIRHAMILGFKGIGVAKTFVHVDTREGTPAVWTYD